MSINQQALPANSLVTELNPAVGTPLAVAREIGSEINTEPWVAHDSAGVLALYQDALKAQYPDEAVRDEKIQESMFKRIPESFVAFYENYKDPLPAMLRDAKYDLLSTLEYNQSPELRTRIEDLKLLSFLVFDRLHSLGLLGHADRTEFTERFDGVHVHFFPLFDKETGGGLVAAFVDRGTKTIGFMGSNNLTPVNFVHEGVHIAVEAISKDKAEDENAPKRGLWDTCMPLAEAMVQHIADRGVRITGDKAIGGQNTGLTDRSAKSFFSNPEFIPFDTAYVYESERRIMYELCEGLVNINDFADALTDPTLDGVKRLKDKLDKQFSEIAYQTSIFQYGVLEFVTRHINGPNADKLCQGLSSQHERAEYTLNLIRDIKGKRAISQASRARANAKKMYTHTRKKAIRAHSSYFS